MIGPVLLLSVWALQEGAEVRVGDVRIPVRVRAKNGERGPGVNGFGNIARGTGILVAHARDRFLHFYAWNRRRRRRLYDVAFLSAGGEVSEVAALDEERLPDPRPSWGISGIRGVTSSTEVRYALFLAPGEAARLGVRCGVQVRIEGKGIEPEEMPAIECADRKIYVEIVATEPERSRGLSYRTGLSEGEGMIFAYRDARVRPFWMYRTFIPLDVCYLRKDGTLLEIHSMKTLKDPNDKELARRHLVPTRVRAQYVMETPYGYMKKAGFKVGDRFHLPKALTSLRPERSPFE